MLHLIISLEIINNKIKLLNFYIGKYTVLKFKYKKKIIIYNKLTKISLIIKVKIININNTLIICLLTVLIK